MIFYRVNHEMTLQGVWYDFEGKFTGLIHDDFRFCENHGLEMDFDDEIVGYLSATQTLEELYAWFPKTDILRLQEHGWYIHEFDTDDYKWYDRFNHWVISQKNSKVVRKIVLTN